MKVLCIRDDWQPNEKTRAIFQVGEALPEKGKIYEVINEVHFENKEYKGRIAYLLKGFDFSAYNIDLSFNSEKFKVIEEQEWKDEFLYGNIVKTKKFIMVVDWI